MAQSGFFDLLRSKVALFGALLLMSTFSFVPAATAEGTNDVACVCEKIKCGPCEDDIGTDFYTEKCGPGLSKVKSCQRRECRKVSDVKACMAKLPLVPQNETRTPAATGTIDVVMAAGSVVVHRSQDSVAEKLVSGSRISGGDRIVTGDDGRVRLRFQELSEVFVSPSSDVTVSSAMIEKREARDAKRTILLNLVKGRIRSRVQGQYDDKESTFRVKTPAAVAGVRGTDFTVSFDRGDRRWTSDVRTLSGKVVFEGAVTKAKTDVLAGDFAAYVVPAPPDGASSFEIEATLARGFMTPVFKMSDEDKKALELELPFSQLGSAPSVGASSAGDQRMSRSPGSREPAASQGSSDSLCRSPQGDFNQCSWSCEGNPKGSKVCRTDLKNVVCVRRLCRASGAWAEATRLPASEGRSCNGAVGASPRVGDCGGYW